MAGAGSIVRLKRCIDDEPLQEIFIDCKRRKFEDGKQEEIYTPPTIFKLAATVVKQEDAFKCVKKLGTKDNMKDNYKTHDFDVNSKLRQQRREESKLNRYKVVNCCRRQAMDSNDDTLSPENRPEYTILDVEINEESQENPTENQQEVQNSKEPQYVYDVYYTSSDDFCDAQDYNLYEIREIVDDPAYNTDDDSEDSNAENYYTNDYPDESDHELSSSADGDDIADRMDKLRFTRELSSEDDDDHYEDTCNYSNEYYFDGECDASQ